MTVNWHREIELVYRDHNPARLPDIDEIMVDFRGYEEALWQAVTKKYHDQDRAPFIAALDGAPVQSAKQRVIRMYAKYAPHKLHDVDQTVELMRQDGPGRVFMLLINKYGPEPPVVPETIRERLLVLFATYDRHHRIDTLDAQLSTYQGMEESLLRRTVNELGPEPHDSVRGDPRDPRERLRRIFEMYFPEGLKRMDLLMARYKGNQVGLFAALQRQYGREPSEYELQIVQQKREADAQIAKAKVKQEEEVKRDNEQEERKRQEMAVQSRLAEIGASLWDSGDLITERVLPGLTKRSDIIYRVRDILRHGDQLAMQQFVDIVGRVFAIYDREVVPVAEELAVKHHQEASSVEFLAMLDYYYCNAIPQSGRVSLRTLVSLLEMKFGSALEEIWVAGGVEPFLAKIDVRSREEWAAYLTLMHGTVTPAELATRNRLRAYYLHYNPGTPLPEVDKIVISFGSHVSNMYEAMSINYGAEPPPIPVDVERIEKIIAKNDPDSLPDLNVIIEAHCEVGDSANDVLRKIIRTYGPEPTPVDGEFAGLFGAEIERRFDLFCAELRVRQVLVRRHQAALNPQIDVLSSIIEGRPKYWDEVGLGRVQASHDPPEIQDLIQEEREARFDIQENSSLASRAILELFGGVLDVWDMDTNPMLAEMLSRHSIVDDMMIFYLQKRQEMNRDQTDLLKWLEGRLQWRAKWARDEEQKREKLQQEEERKRMLAEIAVQEDPVGDYSSMSGAWQPPKTKSQEMLSLCNSLEQQAMKVLRFNAAVAGARRNLDRCIETTVVTSRGIHKGCRFHNPEYRVTVQPIGASKPDVDDSDAVEDTEGYTRDWELVFRQQCHEYVRLLLSNYEPMRLPSMGDLMRLHDGREYQLIAALEQQYDVKHEHEQTLERRVELYYNRNAPDRKSEIPVLLQRFAEKPELLWPYLKTRYGVDPTTRSPEVRQYLIGRLSRFFARVAPHRLPEIEMMIDRAEDHNCDQLFSRLTAQYGPEDPDAESDAISKKLVAFYRKRKMDQALSLVGIIARRFTGRQGLLNEVFRRKFNCSLDSAAIGDDVL